MSGNVIKVLFAKMMSSHYYKASQFQKLQDALKKVSLLPDIYNTRIYLKHEQVLRASI